jgi:anion-transporting  ArsA/GET3 family ATPase
MRSPLQRELVVVTGKGGVGKTTIATALGLLARDRGLRTIIVEVGEQARVPQLFRPEDERATGTEVELSDRLWSLSIDPDRALLEWLQALGGRVSGKVLASSSTFQYFAAAAPGAKELVSMVKIWELTRERRQRGRRYDLVVLDAPATGHALGLLGSPRTFGAVARVGPVARQTERLSGLLEDRARTGYLAVAHPTEMAVTETLELQTSLRQRLGRELDGVIVNGILPRRFSAAELALIEPLRSGSDASGTATTLTRSAALAARAISDRSRAQHNQLARLRRRNFDVINVPFLFTAELDLAAIGAIAEHLRRRL